MRRPTRDRVLSVAVAAVALLCAADLARHLSDERALERANRLALDGRFEEAAAQARRIADGPVAARASRAEAYALMTRRDVDGAREAVLAALEANPSDWELRRDWAVALAITGRRSAAAAQMGRARALNPRMVLPYGFVSRRP